MTVGRFDKGRWVEEPQDQDSPAVPVDHLEERVIAARSSFGKGLDDLLAVSKDLVTTEEGRRHIGKTMDKAGADIMVTLEETAKKATDYITSLLDQNRKR